MAKPPIKLSDTLITEYEEMYSSIEIRLDKLSIIDKNVDDIVKNKSRYVAVGKDLGIPWFFIAIIHSMEATRNFRAHLHNGDPLTRRTTHVPKGRPLSGNPPFTWEFSAEDALQMRRLDEVADWSLAQVLYQMEAYNGWGYRNYHKDVKSPYLWSFSKHYSQGKYIADGTWSSTARSQQIGGAVLLRRLEERGIIEPIDAFQKRGPFFKYSTKVEPRVDELQRFLNTFSGIALLVDGNPGKKTSAAVEKIFGSPLSGTPA